MEPTPDASSLSYTSQSSSPSLPDEVFLDLLGHILGDIQEGPSKSKHDDGHPPQPLCHDVLCHCILWSILPGRHLQCFSVCLKPNVVDVTGIVLPVRHVRQAIGWHSVEQRKGWQLHIGAVTLLPGKTKHIEKELLGTDGKLCVISLSLLGRLYLKGTQLRIFMPGVTRTNKFVSIFLRRDAGIATRQSMKTSWEASQSLRAPCMPSVKEFRSHLIGCSFLSKLKVLTTDKKPQGGRS